MSYQRTLDPTWNPWKWTTIGMAVVFATALVTGVVVAHYNGSGNSTTTALVPSAALPQADTQPPEAPPQNQPQPNGGSVRAPAAVAPARPAAPAAVARQEAAPEQRVRERPSSADIAECNHYASSTGSATTETLTDALFGAAAGAGLGAAGGAIAGGGSGAGKGAGIGGLVGAAAGTLYGLNDSNRRDAQAAASYRACMRRRGYSD